MDLTKEEKSAIASFQKLAEKWPDSLWLFSASGTLCIMKYGEDGERVVDPKFHGMDQAYVVATIHGIDNDGGDW